MYKNYTYYLLTSVTRFGESSPIWQYFQSIWQFVWCCILVLGTILNIFLPINAIGLIFIVVNGQILNKHQTIWWHYFLPYLWEVLLRKDIKRMFREVKQIKSCLSNCRTCVCRKTTIFFQKRKKITHMVTSSWNVQKKSKRVFTIRHIVTYTEAVGKQDTRGFYPQCFYWYTKLMPKSRRLIARRLLKLNICLH